MTEGGIYVHVPFCLTRCGYCAFNAYAGLDHLRAPYLRAVLAEADLWAGAWADVQMSSIFLGGGTPTRLAPGAIGSIVDRLRERFDVRPGAEITCEANPDTVDERSLAGLLAGGVNRLSMGAQSFDTVVLAALERAHRPGSVRAAVRAARGAGFENVSLDLIYGANGETPASWRRTLEEALALEPDHVSCYALTIERGTPLGRAVAAGAAPSPDPDRQAERYDAACEVLAEAGFRHYEISNWARPGRESVHNLGYWRGRPYLGLGPGAHSYRAPRRWWSVRAPERYIAEVARGVRPVAAEEILDDETMRVERLMLGLRLAEGVPLGWLPEGAVDRFLEGGLGTSDEGRLVLTERGMLLADAAF